MSNVVVLCLSFLLILPVFEAAIPSPPSKQWDHAGECNGLLQFKTSLKIDKKIVPRYLCAESGFNFTSSSKTASWKEGTDCCTWDGIICHNVSGDIIKVDLTCSYLRGTLHPNSSLFSLRNLWSLRLGGNHLTGPIPYSVCPKDSLQELDLGYNELSGTILPCLGNLSNLFTLDLSFNQLEGPLPRTLANSTNLMILSLSGNEINDTFPFWLKSLPLNVLQLGENNFHGLITSGHAAFPFPYLWYLMIGSNHFHGQLPSGYFQISNLTNIFLAENMFDGFLPIPPITAEVHVVVANKFIELPSSFCNITTLFLISMSNNSLFGEIPQCLINGNPNLERLDLSMNRFRGPIPEILAPNNCSLKSVVLSQNHFGGKLSQSWASCKKLEALDISDNEVEDSFPSWLETLQNLYILVLSSNKFHGPMTNPKSIHPFSKLHIFDISHNNLGGLFPSQYIANFNNMMDADKERGSLRFTTRGRFNLESTYVTYKEVTIKLQRIQKALSVIDISSNHFQGEIPRVIGNLQSLRGLNFSHNNFQGVIPSSLGNLTNLEWLDLSSNDFTGEIPVALANLTSLVIFNVSTNQLTGQIPQGKQFNTFMSDSYGGNPNLCGPPLQNPCTESHRQKPPSASQDEDDAGSWIEWKVVLMGYGCGIVIGLSIGYITIQIRKPVWIIKMVERKRTRRSTRLWKSSLGTHGRRFGA